MSAEDTAVTDSIKPVEIGEKEGYQVYMLRSVETLVDIEKFLRQYGANDCQLRVVYDRNGSDTNGTIALITHEIFEKLVKDGFDRPGHNRFIVVSPYELRDNCYPGEHHVNSLFVPIPSSLQSDHHYVRDAVNSKLNSLVKWGILADDSWQLVIPLGSRETGRTKGRCYVNFNPEVTLSQRALARVVITDTYWPVLTDYPDNQDTEDTPIFKCFWSRRPRERKTDSEKEGTEDDSDDFKKAERKDVKGPKKGAAKHKGPHTYRLK